MRTTPRAKSRALRCAVLLVGCACYALACSRDDVVVFSYPGTGGSDGSGGSAGTASGGSGSGSGGTATSGSGSGGTQGSQGGSDAVGGEGGAGSCRDSNDCPASWMCEKTSCTDALGVCEPRPIFCEPDPAPVCGCDGITYWNDCVRRQTGASASMTRECELGARQCMVGSDCGVSGASCAHLLYPNEVCALPGEGDCWMLPNTCDPSVDMLHFDECPRVPPYVPTQTCVDTCTAIRSERLFRGSPIGECD